MTAPGALATYQGRNGTLAYQVDTNDPNSGNVVDSDISSISSTSKANCEDPTGDEPPCEIGRFSYSPDGTRIVAERSGQIEVLDADGTNVTVLKQLTSSDTEPAFLPNGTSIVFAGTMSGHRNLFSVNADGTGLKQLTTQGGSWPAPCGNGAILLREPRRALPDARRRQRQTPRQAQRTHGGLCTEQQERRLRDGPQRLHREDHGRQAAVAQGRRRCRVPRLLAKRLGHRLTAEPSGPAGGGYSVDAIVVQKAKNGRRVSKNSIGDNLGVMTGGPLAWQPKR